MNFSNPSKTRVNPSNILSGLRADKKNDKEPGISKVASKTPRPGGSRDTVIPILDNTQSTSVLRKGVMRFGSESTSSQSSIEDAVRPPEDPIPSTGGTSGSAAKESRQQNGLEDDIGKLLAQILNSNDENKEAASLELKKLKKAAVALREKKNSFDSESTSSFSSSINHAARRQAAPLPHSSADQKKSQPQTPEDRPEDPDEIVAVPSDDERERGGAGGFVLEDLQKVKKKETASPSSSVVRRRHPDHVSIEMGVIEAAAENVEQRNPSYLETYLSYMFNCCLSPFKPEGSAGGIWGYCIQFCFVQVIIYWAITIAAILETLASTKYSGLKNIAEGGLENFTNFCFFIMNACLKIYSAYIFTVQQQKFAKLLRSMARLRAFAAQHSKVKMEKYQTWKVTVLAVVSMTVSILSVAFTSGTLEWTLENDILEHAFNVAVAVFVWTPEGANTEGAQIQRLSDDFGENMTGKKALMGFLGFSMELCTRLISNAMSDLILTTAATVEKEMNHLAKDVGNTENDMCPITMESFEAEDGQWAHYQLLEQVVDDTNDTLDCLLKYIHVDNLMLFVYFILNVYDNEFSFFIIVNLVYNIIKAACTYRIGAKASAKNETFQKWIRRLIWKSDDKNFTRKAYVILDHMKLHPLGLGRGQFLIDESFLFRFIGGVGSVFILQAQSRESAAGSTTTTV